MSVECVGLRAWNSATRRLPLQCWKSVWDSGPSPLVISLLLVKSESVHDVVIKSHGPRTCTRVVFMITIVLFR
jgi:hypothetical protein